MALYMIRRPRLLDTATASTRASLGIPMMPGDSLHIHNAARDCGVAEASYRSWRISHGDPDEAIPVALIRLGSSGYYFGTGFAATRVGEYEYVVFDSVFTAVAAITYAYP